MNTTVGFGILAVVLVSTVIPLLRAKNNYRRHVSQAEHLIKLSFEIRHYVGQEAEYFLKDRRLSFLQVFFAKRDISFLAKIGIELKSEYCNGRGQVIRENPDFKERLSKYESDLLKQEIRFWRLYHDFPRPVAPYSYVRKSYVCGVVSPRVSKATIGQMAL